MIKKSFTRGFTLIELLMVIMIIGLLASIVLTSISTAREKARNARAREELHQIDTALELYASDHNGTYPADVNRALPPGIEAYLPDGVWPSAPWPGGVYDWENWAPGDLSYPPFLQVYQISVRFCTAIDVCTIPNEPWATNFDYYSAAYYCVSGPCRSHSSQPVNYPGYCVNCGQ